ncbi:MAG TPA: putative aminohydrolase SsnA [Propioniciclava tarda]|nr:putative aminohydrolase SsnA [Propioniciclava tarda]
MLLIAGGPVLTNDPDNPFIVGDGGVLIDDDLIVAVGPTAELKPQASEVHDVEGKLIMPGLINAHTHAYSAYARGGPVSLPTRNFQETLENLWWRLDRLLTLEDVKLNAEFTFKEGIRNGVTTFFDHHSSPNAVTGSLEAEAKVVRDMGVRASLCFETSDRDGTEIFAEQVAENVDFMKSVNTDPDAYLRGMFGLHAAFTLSQASFEKCIEAKGSVPGGWHVHTAEGPGDEVDSYRKYGRPIVQRFEELGMLGDDSLFIHLVHVNNREMELLQTSGSWAVHNPYSNMGNAVGTARVAELLKRGVKMGLGTDAYTSDMLASLGLAKVLMSSSLEDPTVGFMQSVQLLFGTNPDLASHFFGGGLGRLKAGNFADVITLDYHPHTPFNANSMWGHVIFGLNGSLVNDTMCGGTWLMRDRELLTLDEARSDARSAERAVEIWKHM